MTFEKFNSEVKTLEKSFSIYCKDKHTNQQTRNYSFKYKNNSVSCNIHLCDECNELFLYAVSRLQECPHKEKPRCRKCPNPCYEKDKFKKMAKMMRYSGMKLGLTKLAKKFNFLKS